MLNLATVISGHTPPARAIPVCRLPWSFVLIVSLDEQIKKRRDNSMLGGGYSKPLVGCAEWAVRTEAQPEIIYLYPRYIELLKPGLDRGAQGRANVMVMSSHMLVEFESP